MYLTTRKRGISYLSYSLWVLGEILFMSLFYTMYTIIVKKGLDPVDAFKDSIVNTALVILLPYGVLTLYFAWIDSKKRLEKLESDEIFEPDKPKTISFRDEKGVLRLSVSSDNILYIESSDNYVIVHYDNLGKHKKYLLRNTLKNIESCLGNSSILRCHRSFLVNFSRVKILRRTKEGIVLELDAENMPELPVSKSYQASVSKKLFGEMPDKNK